MLSRLFLAVFLFASSDLAWSQEPPKAPQIEPQQQPERSIKGQQEPTAQPNPADAVPPAVPDGHSFPTSHEPKPNAQNGGKEGTEFWPPFYSYRLKVTDTLLVIVTFLLFGATIALWWSTRRLVRGAEQTAERQLRAYVFPIEAGLKKLNIGNVPEYRVIIKNTGQTPAYMVRHIDRFAFVEFPLKKPLPEPIVTSENFTRTHLGPGGTLEKSGAAKKCDGTPVPFTDRAHEKITGGKAAFYVYGKIDFVDAFMTGGNVEFRSDGKLDICEQGNETSED
jgi:hypothetical protein